MAKKCDACGTSIGFLEKGKLFVQNDSKISSLSLCRGCVFKFGLVGIGKVYSNRNNFWRWYIGGLKSWKFKFPESNNPLIDRTIEEAEKYLPQIQHPYVKQLFKERIQWLKELVILDNNLINLFDGELKEIYLKPLYEICNVLKSCNDRTLSMGISNDSLYYSTFNPCEGHIELEWKKDHHDFFDKILDHNNPNLDIEAVSNEIIQGIRTGEIAPHNWLEEGYTNSNEKIPYKLIKISLDNIIYFSKDGTLEHISVVSGGGGSGGGVNLGGAITGGLLFGGVGALIGSQVDTEIKIDPIKTEIKTEDTRRAFLLYKDDSGNLIQQSFSHEYYNFFMKHFPHKEFSKVQSKDMQTSKLTAEVSKTISEASNIEDIKKYKELLDMGIITQEEFNSKKKQLLGL